MENNKTKIYVKLKNSLIVDIIRIFEGYEYLAAVSSYKMNRGIILLRCTPGTYNDVIEILNNLPFEVEILEDFCE